MDWAPGPQVVRPSAGKPAGQGGSGKLLGKAWKSILFAMALNVYFAALKAATKVPLDGPKALPLETARTLASPGPAVRRGVNYPSLPRETGRGRPVFERPWSLRAF